jgi:hypothetical protein
MGKYQIVERNSDQQKTRGKLLNKNEEDKYDDEYDVFRDEQHRSSIPKIYKKYELCFNRL